jgi:hypothetical protein
MTSPEYTPSFEQQARVVIMPPTRPLPTWLPAPMVPRPVLRCMPPSTKTRRSFRRACSTEFRLERAFMLLLALAGVVGIAYGFSCLIDLVQHWAVFNAGVGQFIQ